jgi:uncharacterized glyoxalase superfamily protein PhnB
MFDGTLGIRIEHRIYFGQIYQTGNSEDRRQPEMLNNRSMPYSDVIPELPYPDVRQAAEWLVACFGFMQRLRIGNHRSQLTFGQGSIVVVEQGDRQVSPQKIMVRVADVDSHYANAKAKGARILNPPRDYPYGERQYSAEDLAGHQWTFSQTIADVDPAEWGGVLLE